MQVILLKDVDRVGKSGEIIKVKDGFASNYLIPRSLAKVVTRKSLKFLEDEKRKAGFRLKKLKVKAEDIKKKLENTSCTIAMQAGQDEKLYGSVTSDMVKEVYNEEGITLDKKQIHIIEHIGKLGVYNVDIKLHPEVTANVKVWVVRK